MEHYVPYARSDVGSSQVEFAGALELAEHRMTETLVEQSAISYKAHAEVVKMVKCRLTELYNDAAINCSKDEC